MDVSLRQPDKTIFMILKGNKIFLRAVLPSDADILYKWENDRNNWDVSETKKRFTKKEIEDFIANQKDIYLDKQLRFMICISMHDSDRVGCIDLFNFSGDKAGVGILIETKYRKKGFASEALDLVVKYSFETLSIQRLYCNVSESNVASMKLFQKQMFAVTNCEKNVHLLELMNN
jgi:diamine N-acetyltransferase